MPQNWIVRPKGIWRSWWNIDGAAEPAAELARVEPDPVNEVVAALSDTATHTAEIEPETFWNLWNAVWAAESGHPERKSNNWLKMHGFPMRRKGKGRKHHE